MNTNALIFPVYDVDLFHPKIINKSDQNVVMLLNNNSCKMHIKINNDAVKT
jgi:hypothetical protein